MRRRATRAVGAALLLSLAACQTELYTGLSERDAMAMVAILRQSGIPANRIISKDGSSAVDVSDSQVAEAVSVLRAAHYPRNEYASMSKLFQQRGLISSPGAERAKLYFGISQELEHTLNDIDGVVDARVHIAPSVSDPVTGAEKLATAAVVLRYDSGVAMDELLPKIKLLVANAVQELSYDRVSVILLPVAPPAPAAPHPAPAPSPWLILGWGLALLWPAVGSGWLLWRRYRKPLGKPAAATLTAVVSDRAA
ncbi:type III secretion inner membrane ring lipoprotein SctJ [Acetobacter sacchari]|uniref:Lipoprotein n=1 Tax=Acetobacter sacchari TaxID=2661687 RepID=A0ABS3LWZ3_9PROT|nr:type III secretion inner membrane ring lipoprotein SctJ [Acetobacter sacchari]MBO1360440.1 type III secretion inner membrane ring lipoprotein SctJ [Acetobacter sacchari]